MISEGSMKNPAGILIIAILLFTCCKSAVKDKGQAENNAPENLPMVRYNLPTFYLTLEGGVTRMGSVTLVLEYRKNDILTGEINENINTINDAVDRLLKKKKYPEMDSVEDYESLKKEIAEEINRILKTGRIERMIISNINIE
jgi:flagellar basal body-associated protein FliL